MKKPDVLLKPNSGNKYISPQPIQRSDNKQQQPIIKPSGYNHNYGGYQPPISQNNQNRFLYAIKPSVGGGAGNVGAKVVKRY